MKTFCYSGDDVDHYTIQHSTASDRLRRVRDIIQFTCEEGYEANSDHPFRPLATTIHTVLIQLLKAATLNSTSNNSNKAAKCNSSSDKNNNKEGKDADDATVIGDYSCNSNNVVDDDDDDAFRTFGNTKNLLPVSSA